jgi:hypothetical protein
MTSVKYETSTLVFNCPHVFCFSNELPEFDKLSSDRWKIWYIENDILLPWEKKQNKKIKEDNFFKKYN